MFVILIYEHFIHIQDQWVWGMAKSLLNFLKKSLKKTFRWVPACPRHPGFGSQLPQLSASTSTSGSHYVANTSSSGFPWFTLKCTWEWCALPRTVESAALFRKCLPPFWEEDDSFSLLVCKNGNNNTCMLDYKGLKVFIRHLDYLAQN